MDNSLLAVRDINHKYIVVEGSMCMKVLQTIISYRVLLPIGLLLIIIYSFQRVNNFIKIRGIMKEHVKIFGGSKLQILFFFGVPVLFATSFVQLSDFNQDAFNTLYVVITILITMFFSILTVLAGYKNEKDEQYEIVLKETRSSILFELIVSIYITIYAFVFQMVIDVIDLVVKSILSWILYYMIFFLLLNMFIVIKRYKILDEIQ